MIEEKLLFNSVLRALLEVYLMTSISVLYSLKYVQTNTTEEKISFVMSLAVLVFCIVFPFWSFKFLRNNHKRLTDADFTRRFDSLFQNLDVSKIEAHPFTLVFCLRRFLFAQAIVNLDQTLVF